MYDDRLEIISPGGMYDGKNIQEVDIDKVASIRRNPIVADIFSRLDYMERRGSGLKRIKEAFRDEKLVEFYSNQSSFYVVMRRQTDDKLLEIEDERLNERIKSEYERITSVLNSNEKLIVDFLMKNQEIANKQAIKITGLSPAQIRRIFVSLQNKGIIEAHGDGRGRYYTLVKN